MATRSRLSDSARSQRHELSLQRGPGAASPGKLAQPRNDQVKCDFTTASMIVMNWKDEHIRTRF
jgi:hypothetical protein